MKRAAVAFVLAACGGGQHRNTVNPTCTDVVEHGYSLLAADLTGNAALSARRKFVSIRPQLVDQCELEGVSLDKKRCIMHADSTNAAERCDSVP
jgi:hypothetical protein